MGLPFVKLEGLGNDFVLVDCADTAQSDDIRARVRILCDRRKGIGADGVICVLPPSSPPADFRMRIFNADGSEAEMCGNGVRCLAEHLRVTGRPMNKIIIETLAGLIEVEFVRADEKGGHYKVNMGLPRFAPNDISVIPIDIPDSDFIMREMTVNNRTFKVTAISMGNPHAVIVVDKLDDDLVSTYGPAIQKHTFFPKSVNVEFIRVVARDEIMMRVYERGCGETQSCGTGACAAVVAGISTGLLGNDVTVHLLGGDLQISWSGDRTHPVYKSGPARAVFCGDVLDYDSVGLC